MSYIFRLRLSILAGAVAACCFIGTAFSADIPPSVEPGRIEQRFQQPTEPKSRLEPLLPRVEKEDDLPKQLDSITFILNRVVMEGGSVYTEADLLPLYEEYIGIEVNLATVYQLTQAITNRYDREGYPLSRAYLPAQRIKDGVVHIGIIEGFVDQVIIEGELADRRDFFSHYKNRITAPRPLTKAALERYLLLADDLAGVKVQSIFRPSTDTQGASTLILSVEQERPTASISLDNRGTESTGPVQINLNGSGNGLFQQYDQATIGVVRTQQGGELRYLSLGYRTALNSEGDQLNFSYSRSLSEPGTDTLQAIELESQSTTATLKYSRPYIRSRDRNLTLYGSFVYKRAPRKTSQSSLT